MIQEKIMLSTGIIVMTRAIAELAGHKPEFAKLMQTSLRRHINLDSDCTVDDKAANMDAVKTGQRVFSVFKDKIWPDIWIITEADRRITTVLFPEDY